MQIAPALVCMDCQSFALTSGARPAATSTRSALDAIEHVLDHARANDWVIVHTQIKMQSGPLGRSNPGTAPIEALRPRRHEFVFERSEPNAYASINFAHTMSNRFGAATFLVGFDGEGSVQTTLSEAARRGHRIVPVVDAIGCAPTLLDANAEVVETWRSDAANLGDIAHVASLPSIAISPELTIGKTSR